MITKTLRTPVELIGYILRRGDSYETSLFIVRFSKNDEHFLRYRAIISKKLIKSAVDRNKLRRQIYEILRINNTKKRDGYDSILIPKKKILQSKFQEIEADIVEKIIKKHNEQAN